LSNEPFLRKCRKFKEAGYIFLGLQSNEDHVSYLFEGNGEVVNVEQKVVDNGVRSIAQVYPLADFAERQMFRDCGIKAFGNINLLPPEKR
jgi:hypothetical protein